MPPSPDFKRGDIVLVYFPHSGLRTAKLRPALIIQADNLKTGLRQQIVAMITSNLSRSGHSSRVLVLLNSGAGKSSGLLTDSVIMTDNLATISETEILRTIGRIQMASVDEALACTLALDS